MSSRCHRFRYRRPSGRYLMIRRYLLFQLYAPFSSWGSPLPGSVRRTDDHPTKSGVMGFLGACLGLTQEMEPEYVQLSASMGFACREDRPGNEMVDFHTVLTQKSTILSDRHYLCGAAFTVCLWQRGTRPTLDEVADVLRNPRYTPFLGRKCCIAGVPPDPRIVEAENLSEAFSIYQPSSFLKLDRTDLRRVFWEGDDKSMEKISELLRSDQPVGYFKYRSRVEFVGRIGV